ncbi:hypothetical protein OS493_019032 [Desmophyllum pertusum]|uniref:Uncharacterized protein n=1 Tax=Desmophyllum pertusum TaxID=174260 RepID=A0A9X0CSF9_9CNID|nr:hypothetical protein OS493_019032 [Desmophyllum pertusum]
MGRMSIKEKSTSVHIPHTPQHNRPGVSNEKSTNKELDERQEDKVKRRASLKSGQWPPASAFPRMLPTRNSFAAEQTKGEEVLKAKNFKLEHNSLSTSYTCPLQNNTKSDGGQSASFSEPSSRQGRDQKMLSKRRGNERGMKAATISVKRDVMAGGDGKLEQNVFEEVCELLPAAGSRAPEAVSRPPQKAMNFQHVAQGTHTSGVKTV